MVLQSASCLPAAPTEEVRNGLMQSQLEAGGFASAKTAILGHILDATGGGD
jgi:hypothetical protein